MEAQLRRKLSLEIRGLLASRLDHINRAYPQLRRVYVHPYGFERLDALREEAALCTILGLNAAATAVAEQLLFRTLSPEFLGSPRSTPHAPDVARGLHESGAKAGDGSAAHSSDDTATRSWLTSLLEHAREAGVLDDATTRDIELLHRKATGCLRAEDASHPVNGGVTSRDKGTPKHPASEFLLAVDSLVRSRLVAARAA